MSNKPDTPTSPVARTVSRPGFILWLAIVVAIPLLVFFKSKTVPPMIMATLTNYHGWPDTIRMSNGKVEIFVVPAIGRIMQFRLVGEEDVFWKNRELDGRVHEPRPKTWLNLGGDKTWPAPEAEWPKPFGGWLPPAAFDSLPVTATIERDESVTLVSPVDPDYGIRTERRIRLDPREPVMTVITTYEKISGGLQRVGIWTITQLKDPAGIFVPQPDSTRFTNGYCLIGPDRPPDLKVNAGLISLTRDPKAPHKIGSDTDTLIWVGEKFTLRIDSSRVRGAEYPDQGSSAEVYTNPDPLKYIELEMLGPLQTLKVGDRISRTNIYTLRRRTEAGAEVEVLKLLGRRGDSL